MKEIVPAQWRSKWREHPFHICISIFLLLLMLYRAYMSIFKEGVAIFSGAFTYADYHITDFMISYAGGFVRRGLSGEILKYITSLTDIPPAHIIYALSAAIYFAVGAFLFYRMGRRGLCRWLLCSPLMLGMMSDIVCKDTFEFATLICVALLLGNTRAGLCRQITTVILTSAMIMIHESYAFYGWPLMALMIWHTAGSPAKKIIIILIPAAVTVLMSLYKGDAEQSIAIINEWNAMRGDLQIPYYPHSAIGALGWPTADTLASHFNFNFDYYTGYRGLVFMPVLMFMAYYLTVNFLYTFSKNSGFDREMRDHMGALYIIIFICLLPLYTVLSSDAGRVFRYQCLATLIVTVTLPRSSFLHLLPKAYVKVIGRFHNAIDRILPSSKGWMLALLMILSVSPAAFNIHDMVTTSLLGTVAQFIGAICWDHHLLPHRRHLPLS